MKHHAVVIYHSQTGFTKKYAEWISEALACECVALEEVKNKDFKKYDMIIFGGWACAGNVSKLKWFKDHMKHWSDKRLAVYCVGASPIGNPDIEKSMNGWFPEEKGKVAVFYCPGGLNYEKMPMPSKLAMKMFVGALKAKKNKTEDEKIMTEMISKSYDISDQTYIVPIVEWAKTAE